MRPGSAPCIVGSMTAEDTSWTCRDCAPKWLRSQLGSSSFPWPCLCSTTGSSARQSGGTWSASARRSRDTLVEATNTGILVKSSFNRIPTLSSAMLHRVMRRFVIVVAYLMWSVWDSAFCFLQLLKNIDLCVQCIIWKTVKVWLTLATLYHLITERPESIPFLFLQQFWRNGTLSASQRQIIANHVVVQTPPQKKKPVQIWQRGRNESRETMFDTIEPEIGLLVSSTVHSKSALLIFIWPFFLSSWQRFLTSFSLFNSTQKSSNWLRWSHTVIPYESLYMHCAPQLHCING